MKRGGRREPYWTIGLGRLLAQARYIGDSAVIIMDGGECRLRAVDTGHYRTMLFTSIDGLGGLSNDLLVANLLDRSLFQRGESRNSLSFSLRGPPTHHPHLIGLIVLDWPMSNCPVPEASPLFSYHGQLLVRPGLLLILCLKT